MSKNKIIFMFLPTFLILFSFSVLAQSFECTDILYRQDWDFTGNFGTQNWVFSSTDGQIPTAPVNSSATNGDFDGLSLGWFLADIGLSQLTSASYTNSDNLSLESNGLDRYIISYNFTEILPSAGIDDSAAPLSITFLNSTAHPVIQVIHGLNSGGTDGKTHVYLNDRLHCVGTPDFDPPIEYLTVIDIDFFTDRYSVIFYNDTHTIDIGCTDLDFNQTTTDITIMDILSQRWRNENSEWYMDNLLVCEGTAEIPLSCNHPRVFCDDFEYSTSLSVTNDWAVINRDGGFNSTFTPYGGTELFWQYDDPEKIGYFEIDEFTTNYQISESTIITSSLYSPRMTIEFDLLLNETSTNQTQWNLNDIDGRECIYFDIRYNGSIVNINYSDTSGVDTNIGTMNNNEVTKIKVEARFGQTGKSVTYPFNNSDSINQFDLYIGGSKVNPELLNFKNDCLGLHQSFFLKGTGAPPLLIDNYLHYVGTDSLNDNTEFFYTDLFTEATTQVGAGDGDLATELDNIWEEFGLISTGSKIIAALLLLLVGSVGMALAMGVSTRSGTATFIGVGVLDIFLMLFFVFTGLLPTWIVILFFIIAAVGGGFLAINIFKS